MVAYRRTNLHQSTERVLAAPTRAAGSSNEEHQCIVDAYVRGDVPPAREAITANVETGEQLTLRMIAALGGMH